MNRTLWKQAFVDARWLWAGCALVLYGFCWIRVWLTSQLDMSRFEGMIQQLPDRWKELSPVPLDQLATYPGRIALAYDDPLVVLLVTFFAISRGSDMVSGPLGRGTLEMLLAQPVSRLQVILSGSLVTMTGIATLTLVAWLGTTTGVATTFVKETPPAMSLPIPIPGMNLNLPLAFGEREPRLVPMREKVDPIVFLPGVVNLAALGVLLAGLATLVSACDRYRWRTIGIMAGVYISQAILKVIALAADGWDWLANFTFFTYFEPERLVAVAVRQPEQSWSFLLYNAAGTLVDLGPLGYDAVLLTIGFTAYLAAMVIFCRRDLPAPI